MHRFVHSIVPSVFAAWLVASSTAAAQQVPPPPAAPATSTGRVSLLASGGVSAATRASGGALGAVVIANVTNRIALEGAGTFTMAGGGMDSQSLTGSVLFNLGVYVRLARREEREVRAEFGEAWDRYAAKTPAFIPRGRTKRSQLRPGASGKRA